MDTHVKSSGEELATAFGVDIEIVLSNVDIATSENTDRTTPGQQ